MTTEYNGTGSIQGERLLRYPMCEGCVFRDEKGHGDDSLGMNVYCWHPVFCKNQTGCPVVQSYHIKRNLGLMKVVE